MRYPQWQMEKGQREQTEQGLQVEWSYSKTYAFVVFRRAQGSHDNVVARIIVPSRQKLFLRFVEHRLACRASLSKFEL